MTSTATGPVLFLGTKSPWVDASANACMDALLTFAVFDVPTTLVLHGAGVLQLLKQQDGAALGLATLAKTFGALGLYGINTIHVDSDSLQQYELTLEDLLDQSDMEPAGQPIKIALITRKNLRSMIASSRTVFAF